MDDTTTAPGVVEPRTSPETVVDAPPPQWSRVLLAVLEAAEPLVYRADLTAAEMYRAKLRASHALADAWPLIRPAGRPDDRPSSIGAEPTGPSAQRVDPGQVDMSGLAPLLALAGQQYATTRDLISSAYMAGVGSAMRAVAGTPDQPSAAAA